MAQKIKKSNNGYMPDMPMATGMPKGMKKNMPMKTGASNMHGKKKGTK